MRLKNELKKALALVICISMICCINIPAYAQADVFTDVEIEYTTPEQVNTKICVGDTVRGTYTYNSVDAEQDTQYRWLYSDTTDFTSPTVLYSGTTTATTVSEDTEFLIVNKLSGKYLVFEILSNDGEVSVKSQPLYIVTKNIMVSDYAYLNSQNKDYTPTATDFLSVRNNSSATRVTLLKFNLEDCEEVSSAVLSFTVKDVYERRTVLAFPAGNGWSKSSTWNSFDWSQIGGSSTGDVSELAEGKELIKLTNLVAGTNNNEMDLTNYVNSELRKGNTSISVALFAVSNDAGISIRQPSRPNDAPCMNICMESPAVSANSVIVTDNSEDAVKEIMLNGKLHGTYKYEGESEEQSKYRWLYSKDKDAEVWFTYKQGITTQETAKADTEITVDKILCGNYIRFEITPVSVDGEIGKRVFSEDVTVMSSKLVPLAAASIKENDKDTSVGMSANSFHTRMDAEGNRRAMLLRYSLEGLEYPIEKAELRYYMYYSSGAGEHVIYDINGEWEDGVTLNQYGSITSIWEGTEIGRATHSGTANQNITPPEKLSVDFTDYVNNALKDGKHEVNFAIWYPETSENVVSYMRGPMHTEYPAQVVVTQKYANINRTVKFSENNSRIEKIVPGKLEIIGESDVTEGITMVAVLFDNDGNMLDICADSGSDGFYAELDNSSGIGKCAEVYFWNGFSELKEQSYICKLTSDGMFEE